MPTSCREHVTTRYTHSLNTVNMSLWSKKLVGSNEIAIGVHIRGVSKEDELANNFYNSKRTEYRRMGLICSSIWSGNVWFDYIYLSRLQTWANAKTLTFQYQACRALTISPEPSLPNPYCRTVPAERIHSIPRRWASISAPSQKTLPSDSSSSFGPGHSTCNYNPKALPSLSFENKRDGSRQQSRTREDKRLNYHWHRFMTLLGWTSSAQLSSTS